MPEDRLPDDTLLKDMEAAEKDPEVFYQIQLAALKIGREMGFSDATLEKSLGIKLRPENKLKPGG